MNYTLPESVVSPRSRWRFLELLHDTKAGGWSLCKGQWENEGKWKEVLAIRWNGDENNLLGNPQSRGNPTWFILPEILEESVLSGLPKLKKLTQEA